MSRVVSVATHDVRFPTSIDLDGSDAVNVDPDYSAAYTILRLDSGEEGHALVFTLGRGNDLVLHAIDLYASLLIGRDADGLIADLGETSRRLVHDSQLRWLGPEKGVTQMACGALLNALWDIKAKRAAKPLWVLLSEMEPSEIVDVIDFTHIEDVLSRQRAHELLDASRAAVPERIRDLRQLGYPAYTTGPGWLGYSDEKLVRLSKAAVAAGFEMIKLKVGRNRDEDRRRLALMRKHAPDTLVAIDANQAWNVNEAIEWINELREFDPYWIEEPTSTDDILGHAEIRANVSPVKVATGEAVANRIIFKQLLQAKAIDILQVDATRVGGINENIANLLLAAHFGVPVCPHAGGVGLCELAQHLAFFDYAAITGSSAGRFIEYVDHLHEHFVEPARVIDGRYVAPSLPGIGAEMLAESRAQWTFPAGAGWQGLHVSTEGSPDRPNALSPTDGGS
jgi:L-fuconate dehydratase